MTIPPGSTVGILGGGQLGRMTAMAAARLGYRCVVLAPDRDCVAAEVVGRRIDAGYEDEGALDEFASSVDVVTIEFENVPAAALKHLADRVPTRPGAHVLEVTQDRLLEKQFLESIGVPVARHIRADDVAGVAGSGTHLGADSIVKTRRLGYDGKGQVDLAAMSPEAIWRTLGERPLVVEERVPFISEISVIAARSPSGQVVCFPPVENRHRNSILHKTIAPADLPPGVIARALEIAEHIAAGLDVVGLIAVEMFLLENQGILVNELAPRPHNSGHWTMEATPVSQFEQLVRAICDLPLGAVAPARSAEMTNLIGRAVEDWPRLLGEPGAHVHIYGKAEIREGRKMGHVTRILPSPRM